MRVGKYALAREVGRGGMGVVYEAFDTLLERPVAIKLVPAQAADDLALARYLREARAAARLNHPHIVAVYDAGEDASGVFIAMELVRGESAYDRVERGGALSWRDATRMVMEVCQGLSAAHGAGLIHRDIKPGNILLANGAENASRPWAKLTDFGLSRSLSSPAPITVEGHVAGTPHYMSPEQIRGERLDERTDIYSLGATYYTLLTGRLPFERDDVIQILFAHCSAPPPDPREAVRDLPPACAAIIARAMAKEPRERYVSAEEMLGDLRSLLGPEQTQTIHTLDTAVLRRIPPFPKQGRAGRSWLAIATVMLLLAVAAGIGYMSIQGRPMKTVTAPPANTSPAVAPAMGAPLRKVEYAALEPVGMTIEQSWSDEEHGSILLGDTLELMKLAPDGRTLAWGISEGEPHHGRLALVDLPRREVVEMYVDKTDYASFSSVAFVDERYFALACSSQVVLYDRHTKRATQLLSLNDGSAASVAVSPDGKRLALGVVEWDGGGRVELFDLHAEEGTARLDHPRRACAGHTRPVKCVVFSPHGQLIASASEDGSVRVSDGFSGEVQHEFSLDRRGKELGYSVAFSPDSRHLAAGGCRGVVTWDLSSGERRTLPSSHESAIASLAFSHDGRYIASAAPDGIRLWDYERGWQVGRTLQGHDSNVISQVAFNNDGTLLLSAGFDRRIRLWSLKKMGLLPQRIAKR